MQLLPSLLLTLHFCGCLSLSYDPADYLEVYPDPRDPAVLRGRTPLHFALIQSLGGQYDGSGAVAGVKVALDTINNNDSILPGYSLHYTFADSQCNRTEGFNVFYSQVLREPRKLAVIGSGCSVATEPTAEISHFYNISQISCVSSSSELRNRLRFPRYFQLLTTEEIMAFGYFGVIKEYEWRKVAFIVQNENLFTVTVGRLIELLEEDGEVQHTSRLFETNADFGDDTFDKNSRIFLLAMYAENARALLCEAHDRNIGPPRHTFLTVAWYSDEWWADDSEGLNCTVKQRECVLLTTLSFLSSGFLDEVADVNLTTDTGLTGGEFLEVERQFINRPPLNLSEENMRYSQYCHDATWTLAFALSNTLRSLSDPTIDAELSQAFNTTSPFRIEDFTYNNDRLLDVIFGHLENTSFRGVTRQVHFGVDGIRPPVELQVFQYRKKLNATSGTESLDLDQIANLVQNGEEFIFNYVRGENETTVWNGLVPYDGVPQEVDVSLHLSVTALFAIFAFAGIVFSGACLAFNFAYRESKLVKLASSQLNYLIGVGAIILYLDMVLFVIPSTDPDVATALCNITPWLTAIGYSLCYGTILMKMARVYYIFNNPSARKKGVQDWMLVFGVILLVMFDLTIIITYMIVEGVKNNLGPRRVPFRENEKNIDGVQGIITKYYVYICDSTARSVFLGVLYGYKMVLQVIALVLAFSIRKVKVKGLNDAKFIGASIYVTSIVLVVTIVGTYTLRDLVNAFAGLVCTGFLIGTTVILILVFVPLMVGLYKDPTGSRIFRKSGSNMSPAMGLTSMQSSEIDTLKKKVAELQSRLKEKEGDSAEPKAQTTPHPSMTPNSDSIADVLQESHMMNGDIGQRKERTFSRTIWDTPKEREENVPGTQNETTGTLNSTGNEDTAATAQSTL